VHAKPGLSFFDEPDLQALFKIRLPYILRTPREVDSLFTAAVNRAMPLGVVSKLVETDWYAHPISVIVRKPQFGVLHIAAGDVLAQLLLIPRAARRARVQVIAPASDDAQAMHADRIKLLADHADSANPYNRLARSRHGRIKG
jgi:hypothetical protein